MLIIYYLKILFVNAGKGQCNNYNTVCHKMNILSSKNCTKYIFLPLDEYWEILGVLANLSYYKNHIY